MGKAKNWTKEEEKYLSDKWGVISVPAIAKNLNRTENAIIVRVQRLGLGAFLESGEYVSFNQLCNALGMEYKYKTTSWIKNRKFPVHTKRVKSNSFLVVYMSSGSGPKKTRHLWTFPSLRKIQSGLNRNGLRKKEGMIAG